MSCKVLTPQSILNGALAMIGRPPKLITKTGDLYDVMGNLLEMYQNKLAIHDGNFILKQRRITLPAGKLEISFVEPSWGRPVMCDLDPASLPPNITLPRRDVNLISIQDQDQFRNNVFSGSAGSGLTTSDGSATIAFAQAVSWLRDGSTIKLFFEFGGFAPGTDSTYRFFYQPGGIAEVMEDQNVEWLPNFIGLLQCDFALAILPLSGIAEPDYTRFKEYLQGQITRREPVLDLFLQNDHREQTGYAPGYARSRVGGHQRAR